MARFPSKAGSGPVSGGKLRIGCSAAAGAAGCPCACAVVFSRSQDEDEKVAANASKVSVSEMILPAKRILTRKCLRSSLLGFPSLALLRMHQPRHSDADD